MTSLRTLPRRSLALSLLATLAATACGGDSPGGSGESSTTEATTTGGETTTTAPMTTEPMESSTTEVADSSSGEVTTGTPEVTIIGTVQDLPFFTPIPDAAVSVIDMAGFETTTDENGVCSIGPVPADTELFIQIQPSADYFGTVIGLTATPGEEEQDLAQISFDTVNGQIEILQNMMPAEADLTQSIVVVRLLQESVTGVTIEMEPAPDPTAFYSPDMTGAVVLGKNSIEFGLLPVVVYFNIPASAAGDIVVTPVHASKTCSVVHPSFPTIGGHVTLVDVDCS